MASSNAPFIDQTNATVEGPYIASGAIPPFSCLQEVSSSGTVAVQASGAPPLMSAHSETIADGDRIFVVRSGNVFGVASTTIAAGASVVATTGGEIVTAGGTAVSTLKARQDGSGLAGWPEGAWVPLTLGNPGKIG
jgi:hypothetical protein